MICTWYLAYHSWYFKIVSNFTRLMAREITYNNFEISPVVFMPNITTNRAITYTNIYKTDCIWLWKENLLNDNATNFLVITKFVGIWKLTLKLTGGGGFLGSILTTLDSTFGGGRKLFLPTCHVSIICY